MQSPRILARDVLVKLRGGRVSHKLLDRGLPLLSAPGKARVRYVVEFDSDRGRASSVADHPCLIPQLAYPRSGARPPACRVGSRVQRVDNLEP